MKRISLSIIVMLTYMISFISTIALAADSILPQELIVLIDNSGISNFIILDIRDIKQYEAGRIPGAVYMPFESLKTTHRVNVSGKKIIIYGETDLDAIKGVEVLSNRGIDASYLKGGFTGWVKVNGKVEKGSAYTKGLPDRFTIPRGLCAPLPPADVFGE